MGRRKKEPRSCIFCKGLVTGEGEHIIQRRLLLAWSEEPDGHEFCLEHPRGKATSSEPYQLMIDVCRDCNRILNKLFDTPATEPSKTLLDRGEPIHGQGVEDLVRWIIKTIVLWHDPRSYWKSLAKRYPGWTPANRWSLPDEALVALRDGIIPIGVTLWVALTNADRTVWGPGITIVPRNAEQGFVEFGLPDGRSLIFHLRYDRPSDSSTALPVENAFADHCAAMQLWPDPPASLDLKGLHELPADRHEGPDRNARKFTNWFPREPA